MDEFNKSKAFELTKKNDEKEDDGRLTQKIFGVEINVGDNDLNGIIEKHEPTSKVLGKTLLHLEELEWGC